MYWRWANCTENLPFGSVSLLWIKERAADRIKLYLCRTLWLYLAYTIFGQWQIPFRASGYCGGAEEQKPSNMLFTSELGKCSLGVVDPIYLSEEHLCRDLDHEQDGMEIEVPKTFNFAFPKEDGKYSENGICWNGKTKHCQREL